MVLDDEFSPLAQTQVAVSSYEFFRALSYERTRFPELISPSLTARIEGGGKVTRAEYEAGIASAQRCRARIADVLRDHDVLIAPSAPAEAPAIDTTGDPVFGLMWTLLQLPCLTLPYGRGPAGLPLGVQVVGGYGEDSRLFVHAQWIRQALG